MKRTVLLGVLTVGALAVAASSGAYAVCSPPVTFGQYGYQCGGSWCYVFSPGQETPASFDESFWAWTFGSTTNGVGDDNGTYLGWFGGSPGAYYVTGSWGTAGVDGCIAGKVGPGKTDECQITVVADTNAAGSIGYWAAVSTTRVGAASPQVNLSNMGTPITLVAIPKPFITASTRVSSTQTQVTVRCDVGSSGFYDDGCNTFSEVVTGCNFYTRVVARDAAAPSDRTTSGWTPAGSATPGNTATVTVDCANNSDAYVAAAVSFDSGFETSYVSENSTKVECGPDIAEPREPKFKLIKNRRDNVERQR